MNKNIEMKSKRAVRFTEIGKVIDRYESIVGSLPCERFDLFIDLDVSAVDTKALAEADDSTLVHDVSGIYSNLERNRDNPEKSELKYFVPRVGFCH